MAKSVDKELRSTMIKMRHNTNEEEDVFRAHRA